MQFDPRAEANWYERFNPISLFSREERDRENAIPSMAKSERIASGTFDADVLKAVSVVVSRTIPSLRRLPLARSGTDLSRRFL
ncbi:hypothetical protein HMPREF0972_01146 [Actinomyces sp. oral taxon 848 str. F0332]|nr:hypothetical protein HMPREF0972_01146 [Actinomyces sp. oral taxon 848 str. F0332]